MHDRATWHNFSTGATRQTGNPLDVSIDGDAFLVVQTPRGERYTRNGALQINATGELVTNGGDRVLGDGGPIQFQPTDSNISINPDGTITVREGGNAASDSARGRLRLVRFDQVQTLLKDGSSMFRAPDGTAPQPADANVRVVQGTHRAIQRAPGRRDGAHDRADAHLHADRHLLQQASDHRRNAIDKLAEVPA